MAKKLPQNPEAEKVVLGLMLMNRGCLINGVSLLEESSFYKKTHKLIFSNIKALFEVGKEIGLLSLTEQLKSTNSLSAVGGAMAISELIESGISESEFNTHLEILKDKASKREVISAADKIITAGFDDKLPRDEFLKLTMDTISESTRGSQKNIRVISSGDIYTARRQVFLDRLERNLVSFGYENLDSEIVSGMAPTDISILAARPGMGKSALKTNLKINLLRATKGVVSFELEQGFATEQDRMESVMTHIPLEEIIKSRNWRAGDDRIDLIKKANEEMDDAFNYHIIPSRGLGLSDVRTILYQISF